MRATAACCARCATVTASGRSAWVDPHWMRNRRVTRPDRCLSIGAIPVRRSVGCRDARALDDSKPAPPERRNAMGRLKLQMQVTVDRFDAPMHGAAMAA